MPNSALDKLHPAVRAWFERSFAAPTPAQIEAWPAIKQGRHTLIAAPTGSGKTLAAFLAAIDDLVREGLDRGLPAETRVLYVSPLRALSNDIQKNLQQPLQGIADSLSEQGLPDPGIRSLVRTGDTPQTERQRMRREPPHILVTTPESLFILLTSDSGRRMLATVRRVIVDEIHALAGNKRGSHLSLSLERLQALTDQSLVRIGLSATQRPLQAVARFLIGDRDQPCTLIDSGHVRDRDLRLEVPGSPLEAVMSTEVWQEVYDRLAALIEQHRTTLIFVNTRRLAERAARYLGERLGEEHVTSHHGSLAREHRLDAEQRLKQGRLKALVATSSLELGIDIGEIDLVCQLGSPRAIAALLQRVGRSGHSLGGLPRGRLFPLSRDDLVECTALLDAVRRDELDQLAIPAGHRDVLAQQVIAEVACRDWDEDELYRTLARAWPYRGLEQAGFEAVLQMLAEGFTTRRGRRSRYLYRDAVNRRLKSRPGARLTAVTNAGAIPDQFDYDVVLEPAGLFIGTLNEDFAFESLPGDIFQLGNTSYRILKVETGKVRVEDARGQPPNIPFWFGEAPGRSDELSHSVSRLRAGMDRLLQQGSGEAHAWLVDKLGLTPACAQQLVDYLAATRAALGLIPTQQDLVFERFFDETGDQHLVIHSPFGSRLNRAWGLGLRKRFCRRFNFELQAAALEDTIVLSLGAAHSFPLEEATRYLRPASVRDTVIQAMLPAPMFMTHWRWNATVALAIRRHTGKGRVPPQFQRMNAEDLMAVVFPDQLACQDNLAGEREVPDHPLVDQTIDDCLHGVMDIDGLERLLQRLEDGSVRVHCRDLGGPSPIAHEILGARPYAFLDDAPAEERRTRAVAARRFLDPADAAQLGRLDPEAVQRVLEEAWPETAGVEALHDALLLLGYLTAEEGRRHADHRDLAALGREQRAAAIRTPGGEYWCCAERLPLLQALFPEAGVTPPIPAAGPATRQDWDRATALRELVRGRLEGLGPVTEPALAEELQCGAGELQAALLALEQEGFAMRGSFTGAAGQEWCERGLLARMHRYTLQSLREAIQPVTANEYMRFLLHWHGLGEDRAEGEEALLAAIERLEGCCIAAGAWERDILPARIRAYNPADLDRLCSSGRLLWTRLPAGRSAEATPGSGKALLRNTPLSLLDREAVDHWWHLAGTGPDTLSSSAAVVYEVLQRYGALFFIDIVRHSGQLRSQAEEALAELAARGLVTSDSFAGLRALLVPAGRRPRFGRQHGRPRAAASGGIDAAGRWSLLGAPGNTGSADADSEAVEHIARGLLHRYGVVFRRVLEREALAPPWRELLLVYRRMEARGEVRGGRFVEGFSGEQFALPESVGLLRRQRRTGGADQTVVISATDPLNLVGNILPGERVPALPGNRIVLRNGIPAAKQIKEAIHFLQEMDPATQWQVRNQLGRRANPAGFARPSRRPV